VANTKARHSADGAIAVYLQVGARWSSASWDMKLRDPLQTRPTWVTLPNLIAVVQTSWVYIDIRWKRFSRSLTYEFLLTFHP